jgi:ABC-type lipoprotein release transport system permease subunit
VKPHDALTLFLVSAFLFAIALLATYIPAHRASRIDPMEALRHE